MVTFFTPVGEMGLVLHELYEISGLVIGDTLHEEYTLTTEELHLLKKEDPQGVRDLLGSVMPLSYLWSNNWLEEHER